MASVGDTGGDAGLARPKTIRLPSRTSGMWALCRRELVRHRKWSVHSVFSPAASAVLFYLVLGQTAAPAIEAGLDRVAGLSLMAFLAPGIIFMSMVYWGFNGPAVAMIESKMEGYIQDELMAPIGPTERIFAHLLPGIAIALVAGAGVAGVTALFTPITVHAPLALIGYGIGGVVMLGLIGLAIGVWSQKWDHFTAMSSLIVMPLAMLSGTFYSLESLPSVARPLVTSNPLFYAIDGFRYGMTGHIEANPMIAPFALVAGVLASYAVVHWQFASGYRVRS